MLLDVCWICHLTIDLSMDRTFTFLKDSDVYYAHMDCAQMEGFRSPAGGDSPTKAARG